MTISAVEKRPLPSTPTDSFKDNGKLKQLNLDADDGKNEDALSKFENFFQFQTKLVWNHIIITAVWHLISLYFVFTFPFSQHKGLLLWAFIMAELNLLSITAGVHRLWTHRSYKAKLPLRIFLAVFYIATGMNKISHWVREHRIHHKYTDTDADPHNSYRGFFFSHIGWQMMRKHPEIKRLGKTIDYSDMKADPVVVFFDKHFRFFKIFLCFILPVFIPVYFFGADLKAAIITQWFFRYPYVVNVMFSVNSFAHFYGYRSYDKTIRPTENGIISLFTTGEGWHNYHHAFPWDYKAAELGGFFLNRTTAMINLFAKIGWAYDMKEMGPELIKRIVERKGDGSHAVWTSKADQQKIELVNEHPY